MTPTQRLVLLSALFAYACHTGRSLRQQHSLSQRSSPRLHWSNVLRAALKYTWIGQLIASSEYLLCLLKPFLAARIGRLVLRTPRGCCTNRRYGVHERHRLDVYGVQEGAVKPVLVFIHGGAWSYGHKWQYALVGQYLATQGLLVAVVNYRTFSHGSVVEMVEDVENAVFWVAENCRKLGGDRNKLFLSGHSSGGHVGALALVNSALRLASNDTKTAKEKELTSYVCGFIGLAAPYDISDHYIFESQRIVGPFNGVHEISSMKPAMLGMDNFKKYSPTALVEEARHTAFSLPPFYLVHGGNDTVVPPSSSIKLADALSIAGQTAEYYEVGDCTHEDVVFAIMGENVNCRAAVVKTLKRIMLAEPVGSADALLPALTSPLPLPPKT
uniref:BD-FAE-like domain-containing protein n=1 Tax=Peronospora matthiolae TaxID=2874970 RepID=A0AAV1TW80_9STRA